MSDEKQLLDERFDKMTRVLRALGAVLLLTSASSFLIHRWDSGNDLLRFGFLLAHSFVILAAALFCGGKLGESRSARLFLWTNLAMVPAHFAVLGGLVYSQFSLDAAASELPKYAVWVAPDRLSVLLATVATFITVLPTSLISARVLSPQRGRLVTVCYVGLCALLLVPVRGADGAAILASAGAVAALVAERKWFAKDYRTRTTEGRLVRALMGVPVVLLVVRTAAFYDMSSLFLGLLIMVAALCGWVLTQSVGDSRANVEAGEWLSVLVGAVGLCFVLTGFDAFEEIGTLCLLSLSGLLILASRLSKASPRSFESAAVLSALVICGVALGFEHTLLEGTLSIAIGAAALAYSILMGSAILGTFSALLTVAGLAAVFDRAIGFEHLANWGTLSVLGVGVVVAAAFVERHREAIVEKVLSRRLHAEALPVGGPLPSRNKPVETSQ